MEINGEKTIVVWLDELHKVVFTKEMPNTRKIVVESAEDLSRLVLRGYRIG